MIAGSVTPARISRRRRMEVGRRPCDGFGRTARPIPYFAQIGVDVDVKERLVPPAGAPVCVVGYD